MNLFKFNYTVSFKAKKPNHILFEFDLNVGELGVFNLSLPVWRPGRYEKANYAKFIKDFSVLNAKGSKVKYQKINSSEWQIQCKTEKKIRVSYSFYTDRIDAGFSYADKNQIYLNPVNCFFYLKNEKCEYEISFKGAKSFNLYSPLKSIGVSKVHAESYDELFDSPTVFSNNAKIQEFKVGKYNIVNVFQGICEPNTAKIERDFSKFIDLQIREFGDLPVKEFTFLNQITSHRFYHGVEHKKNTVLAFGPGYLLDEKNGYDNFLGLACHEFYHIWNVKHLRPKSLLPYDFSDENPHSIGFVIEGVTTYQGDIKLWQSKVFNDLEYFKLLSDLLSRHLNNPGRFNQSVRESSIDLWLDGYEKGIPGKKVSIYNEGALISFILDVLLLEKTRGKYSLDTVMKEMYESFAKKGKGYTQDDYFEIIKKQGGNFISKIYSQLIDSASSYEPQLKKCLDKLGLDLIKKPISIGRSYLGISLGGAKNNNITEVLSGSPAEEAGLVKGMTILSINDLEISNNLENWLGYFFGQEVKLLCAIKGDISAHKMNFSKESLAHKISLKQKVKRNKDQEKLFRWWRKY